MIAIRAEKLSKQYRIRGRQTAHGYDTLRDRIADQIVSMVRWRRRASNDETFWALKDLSFEVGQGEVIGIIGRNGAGKSTLLKILSRVTEPTSGFVEIHGRVASLLEVGTGFHAELSGRENTYLNGAILGMRKAEIDRKFDEIVAFAEVERFIDSPVKHYSSGMYLRLAFAVAAHLEPEILCVDEVLAVGDARFQKKCLDKMGDTGQRGRTVLFVSHNIPVIRHLCQRAILLGDGGILADGPSAEVTAMYLQPETETAAVKEWSDTDTAPGGEVVRLRAVRVRGEDGPIAHSIDIRSPVAVEMEYEVLKPGCVLLPHFGFYNHEGICAFVAQDLDPAWRRRPRPIGRYVSSVSIPGNFFADGTIFVSAALNTLEPFILQFREASVVSFEVVDSFEGNSARGDYHGTMRGVVRPLLEWHTDDLR
jgi:lipopolysaccharide transport system ATP-binding protein